MNMTFNVQEHWEKIYQLKPAAEVSWYQEKPTTSLRLIAEMGLAKNASIIDVGGGDSLLVDNLLEQEFKDITVLDISPTALQKAKERLERNSREVNWIVADVRELETNRELGAGEQYGLWHDRAVLHFLTTEEEIKKYVQAVRRFVKPKGYIIISAFSINGPTSCSGLEVQQYSKESLQKLFTGFEHLTSFEEEHVTPWQTSQVFIYSLFRKNGDQQ